MDKTEFNERIERLKRRIEEEDYATALTIIEDIDWQRVRNTNLLNTASLVYEKNGRLQEAKDVLVIALERSPIGKHLLYKLTELSVMSGDLEEAEDYYYEFHELAPEDISNYVLQYMLLKAHHAPFDQQIDPLQKYCEIEPDEKWMYELASAYESAGCPNECVAVCDKIALLFGASQYALRALRLKQRYAQLTEEQRSMLYPRSTARPENVSERENGEYTYGRAGTPEGYYYESDETDLEQEKAKSDEIAFTRYENEDAVFYAYVKAMEQRMKDEEEMLAEPKPEPVFYNEEQREEFEEKRRRRNSEERRQRVIELEAEEEAEAIEESSEPEAIEETEAAAEELVCEETMADSSDEEDKNQLSFSFDTDNNACVVDNSSEEAEAVMVNNEEELPEILAKAEQVNSVEASLATAPVVPSEPTPIPIPEALKTPTVEPKLGVPDIEIRTPHPENMDAYTEQTTSVVEETKESKPAISETDTVEPVFKPTVSARKFHMIVEADTIEEGIELAIERLKKIHTKYELSNSAAKTNAEKLNQKGLSESIISKIEGKDFVVEKAGDILPEIADELYKLIKNDKSSLIVVLVDTPEGLDKLEDMKPELFDICDYISTYDEEDEKTPASKSLETEEREEHIEKLQSVEINEDKAPVKRSVGEVNPDRTNNVKVSVPEDDNAEMEMDDFAEYCKQYAEDIDCSIDGKSMLALYERIELMEENGIALTKANAEQLIEDAADRAEKPPIGKKLSGLFRSKYDKNGLLILKENDFIY